MSKTQITADSEGPSAGAPTIQCSSRGSPGEDCVLAQRVLIQVQQGLGKYMAIELGIEVTELLVETDFFEQLERG